MSLGRKERTSLQLPWRERTEAEAEARGAAVGGAVGELNLGREA